jgi:hypothetical protein
MSGAILNRRWARTTEMWTMAHLLVLLCGLTSHMTEFKTLTTRMVTLWRASGKKFLVAYLKETVRMVIAFLNHSLYTLPKGGTEARKDRRGLPTIVPGKLRHHIRLARDEGVWYSVLVTRAVLTILSFYRVMSYSTKPSLKSITDSFGGVDPLFPSGELGVVLTLFPKVSLGKPTLFISESAGPNGPKATWFSAIDAISFLYNPRQWAAWTVFAFRTNRFALWGWFLSIQMMSLPFLPLIGVLIRGRLGSLAALKEGAGKVRIVAITDWWTQVLFRPLHDGLFSMLRLIPQDGTHDQWKPVEEWVIPRLRLGLPCFSFDLSSATDRLPVAAQKQILTHLFGKVFAWAWCVLLDRDWWFQGKPIRYAVGQPMGAYSSWAMLAVMHHVVVQMAAMRSGWVGWFPFYAIVGDDIVIADKGVAEHYLTLMRTFGVSISLHKSIVSESGLLEFAKRWFSGTRGELSALGPGLLLATVRNIYFLPILIVQMYHRGWLIFPEHVERFISFAKKFRNNISGSTLTLMIATVLGPSGLLGSQKGQVTACAELWFTRLTGMPLESAYPLVDLASSLAFGWMWKTKARATVTELRYFLLNWFKWPVLRFRMRAVAGILSIPVVLVSPAFWIYFGTLLRAVWLRNAHLDQILEDFHSGALQERYDAATPETFKLDLPDQPTPLVSINWKQRKVLTDQFKMMEDLQKKIVELLAREAAQADPTAMVVYSDKVEQFRHGESITSTDQGLTSPLKPRG